MSLLVQRLFGFLIAAVAGTVASAAASAMVLPDCARPTQTHMLIRHQERHYIENSGPIQHQYVKFIAYSILSPIEDDKHFIRNSVCNLHPSEALNFKWERSLLANEALPPGECWCREPRIKRAHNEITVLEPSDSDGYIQFTYSSPRNRTPAQAFIPKSRTVAASQGTLEDHLDLIVRKAGAYVRERISFKSVWNGERVTLEISSQTDAFLLAVGLPPQLVDNARGYLADRKSQQTTVFAIKGLGDLGIKMTDSIPNALLTQASLAITPRVPVFSDTVLASNAQAVEALEVGVAVFTNDTSRNFVAAAPVAIYSLASR